MDRKNREYYLIFFKDAKEEQFRSNFSIENQKKIFGCHAVKIHFKSMGSRSYVMIGFHTRYEDEVVKMLERSDLAVYKRFVPRMESRLRDSRAVIDYRLFKLRSIYEDYKRELDLYLRENRDMYERLKNFKLKPWEE